MVLQPRVDFSILSNLRNFHEPGFRPILIINAQRDRAWKVWPYPCIGQFRFLNLSISRHPLYPILQKRLDSGQTLLDLGCCFGQDIRKLVADGAPAQNLIGCDLHQAFIDLGYDLFRDRDTLSSRFFEGDILAPQFDDDDDNNNNHTQNPFHSLLRKTDIIHASLFFHLFTLSSQQLISKRLLTLLRPEPGSLILGRQTANVNPGVYTHGSRHSSQPGMWRHDVQSWTKMWEQAGEEVGVQVRVKASLEMTRGFFRETADEGSSSKETEDKNECEEPDMSWRNEGDRLMVFEIWRL